MAFLPFLRGSFPNDPFSRLHRLEEASWADNHETLGEQISDGQRDWLSNRLRIVRIPERPSWFATWFCSVTCSWIPALLNCPWHSY